MSTYSLEQIIHNYELLGDNDPFVRESANIYLMGLVYQESAWKITQQMITNCNNQGYQLLGAQLLYQKLQKQIVGLEKRDILNLKHFLLFQLANVNLNIPTIRKISSSISLIAVVSCLEQWPDIIADMVGFMKESGSNLQNGLVLLSSLAQQLSKNNTIRQGIKMKVKEKILERQQLISQIFVSALTLSEGITAFTLQAIECWVSIGYPLIRYRSIINLLIILIQKQPILFFQNCCKILSQSIKISSQLKFQTLSSIDLSTEIQKYTPDQIQSIKIIINYLRSNKNDVILAIKSLQGLENIQFYTTIVKELLLSFGFLLLQQVGFQLLEIMINTLLSKNLKLSYSTFQFWLDFCQKWSKTKVDPLLQQKIWRVIDYLLSILFQKIKLQSEEALMQLIKDQDTVDDLEDISFNEYRKQSQYVLKSVYEYFTKMKQSEGSKMYFTKLLQCIEEDQKYLSINTELSIYIVKSLLESLVKEYDTLNLISYIQYLIDQTFRFQNTLPRISAAILAIIKDCNRQIKQRDDLFLKCLTFSLKYVEDQQLCHHAVYAFQSLMQTVQKITSLTLVNDLLAFYQSKTFKKQVILQKILDGILTSITKIEDLNAIAGYFNRILNAISHRNNQLISNSFSTDVYLLPLIQIKTVLDCFQHFAPNNQQFFREIFLTISNQGISMVTKIIANYIQRKLSFSNVNQLGLSLAVCRSSLKICCNSDHVLVSNYITLMNIILTIFNPQKMEVFLSYSSLIEIISKILYQFANSNSQLINNWVGSNLMAINIFFLSYGWCKIKNSEINKIDPDIIKQYYTIQQSIITYNQSIFLSQNKIQQILNLSLICLQNLNEKQMQRKIIYFLYLCVQIKKVFIYKYNDILKTIIYSVPIINNICFINIGRIFVTIFEGTTLPNKQAIFNNLLSNDPYKDVDKQIKQIMAKFLSFVIQTKIQRYIKAVINDLVDIKWKKTGKDITLHLEMRFNSWKKQYNRMVKNGQIPK